MNDTIGPRHRCHPIGQRYQDGIWRCYCGQRWSETLSDSGSWIYVQISWWKAWLGL